MKLDNRIYVVCDANGECKGLFTNEKAANTAADYFGAYVSSHDEISEDFRKPMWVRAGFKDEKSYEEYLIKKPKDEQIKLPR